MKEKRAAGVFLLKDPVSWHVWLTSSAWRRAKLVHSCQSRKPSDQGLDRRARLQAAVQTRQTKALWFLNISPMLAAAEPPRPPSTSVSAFRMWCLKFKSLSLFLYFFVLFCCLRRPGRPAQRCNFCESEPCPLPFSSDGAYCIRGVSESAV